MSRTELILDSHLLPNDVLRLKSASKMKRLLNLVLDYIGFFLVLTVCFFFSALMGMDDFFYQTQNVNPNWQRFQGVLAMFFYYVISEHYLEGKTLGKFITGTKVVTKEGYAPCFKAILIRAMVRFIPFEPFSYLGFGKAGWHDRISNTKVVVDRE